MLYRVYNINREQYWSLPPKRTKKGPNFIWNNWYVASLQKIKQMFPAQAGNICTFYCLDPHWPSGPLRSDYFTISVPKRKLLRIKKIIDLNCSWLPVCSIYVNDCIYECMDAFNLQAQTYSCYTIKFWCIWCFKRICQFKLIVWFWLIWCLWWFWQI